MEITKDISELQYIYNLAKIIKAPLISFQSAIQAEAEAQRVRVNAAQKIIDILDSWGINDYKNLN